MYPEVVETTPGSSSKGGSMHQKQPPANVATASSCSAPVVATEVISISAIAKARIFQLRRGGRGVPAGMKRSARPLLHQRCPVGLGPSSKTWPWWPPQRAQWYSVRGRISLKSRRVDTRPASGRKKLGQPVPLSNLVEESNSARKQAAQR